MTHNARVIEALSNDAHPTHEELIVRVYDKLRRLAANYLRRERADHTLQPTALVHEMKLTP